MSDSSLAIGVCDESDRNAALTLVLRSLPANQRGPLVESLASLREEPLGPFDALVVAKQGRRVIAATWAQPQPGRTASLWLPEFSSRFAETVAASLIEQAVRVADDRGVSMAQVLLDGEQHPLVGPLHDAAFERVAELLYLEWAPPQKNGEIGQDVVDGVVFEPHAADDLERLKKVIAATYIDTLDCPKLEGLRDLSDTLSGYQQIGVYAPSLWWFLRLDDQDAGVLLLAEHPSTRQVELVYMGVMPMTRGRGVGAAAIQRAQQVTVQKQADRLVLAVDAANGPAMRLYRAAGFVDWASRIVFIRQRGGAPFV